MPLTNLLQNMLFMLIFMRTRSIGSHTAAQRCGCAWCCERPKMRKWLPSCIAQSVAVQPLVRTPFTIFNYMAGTGVHQRTQCVWCARNFAKTVQLANIILRVVVTCFLIEKFFFPSSTFSALNWCKTHVAHVHLAGESQLFICPSHISYIHEMYVGMGERRRGELGLTLPRKLSKSHNGFDERMDERKKDRRTWRRSFFFSFSFLVLKSFSREPNNWRSPNWINVYIVTTTQKWKMTKVIQFINEVWGKLLGMTSNSRSFLHSWSIFHVTERTSLDLISYIV